MPAKEFVDAARQALSEAQRLIDKDDICHELQEVVEGSGMNIADALFALKGPRPFGGPIFPTEQEVSRLEKEELVATIMEARNRAQDIFLRLGCRTRRA